MERATLTQQRVTPPNHCEEMLSHARAMRHGKYRCEGRHCVQPATVERSIEGETVRYCATCAANARINRQLADLKRQRRR